MVNSNRPNLESVHDIILAAICEHLPQTDMLVELKSPPDSSLGDFSVPCFRLASAVGIKPADVAQSLARNLPGCHGISSAAAHGPYVNVRLERKRFAPGILMKVIEQGATYGSSQHGAGKTIVIDFSHPNIAKPFHVGHLRSTNLGASISRILSLQGFSVFRKNYLGDWGTQFGFVIHGWRKYGNPELLKTNPIHHLVSLYIRVSKEAEDDAGVREAARDNFRRLELGDPEIIDLWKRFRDVSIESFKRTYSRLGIEFDSYDGEAAIGALVDEVVERFRNAGLVRESEGALVIDIDDSVGRLPPLMLRKSDGSSTYATRDLAEAIQRYENHHFERNIYVVARQDDHFAQVFGALRRLAAVECWPDDWTSRCEVASFGFVRGMSTRRGEVVWLDDLLDEAARRAVEVGREKSGNLEPPTVAELATGAHVGLAAVLFSDVAATRARAVDFSWESALRFEGCTGPYLQYTHARAVSILEKASSKGLDQIEVCPAAFERLFAECNNAEWQLVLRIDEFPASATRAAELREPHEIARYLYYLANSFNGFYSRHQVIDESAPISTARRILLTRATKQVLKTGLGLLGIHALDSM